uniref:CHK domain-containing protein n=1 Tax=Glossina austeni TaxID=7395 RepID=A0A1A9V8Z4_GLOAU
MSTKALRELFVIKNFCHEIIGNYNREHQTLLTVKEFFIEPVTEVVGFLCDYHSLTLQCFDEVKSEKTKTLKFFIKSLPVVDEKDERIKIFEKEKELYRCLLPNLLKYSEEIWLPRLYLCDDQLLILEDLREFDLADCRDRLNLSDVQMFNIMRSLAIMHSSSIVFEYCNDICIGEAFTNCLQEITLSSSVPWFNTGLNALVEVAKIHPKYKTVREQAFIANELLPHLYMICSMADTSLKYRNVLCHRDLWGGNIFLNHKNPHRAAVFVDFQTCRYSPPAIDIIFILFMNLSRERRILSEYVYLRYYYRQLLKNFEYCENKTFLAITEQELHNSYKEFQLLGLVYRFLGLSILNVPRAIVNDHYKNVERSKQLLEHMQRNKEFCSLIFESVEDIIDWIIERIEK